MSDKKTLEEQCLEGCKTPLKKPFFQIYLNGLTVCSESFRFSEQNTLPLICKYCDGISSIEVKNHKFLPSGYYDFCTYRNKIIDPDLLTGLKNQDTEE